MRYILLGVVIAIAGVCSLFGIIDVRPQETVCRSDPQQTVVPPCLCGGSDVSVHLVNSTTHGNGTSLTNILHPTKSSSRNMSGSTAAPFITALRPKTQNHQVAGTSSELFQTRVKTDPIRHWSDAPVKDPTQRRLFECVEFNSECAMIHMRLHELRNVVDNHIIVESTYTHSGRKKPLYMEYCKPLIEEFWPKITYIVADETPTASGNENCLRQRQHCQKGVPANIPDTDLIMWHDVDEIPNPEALMGLKNGTLKMPKRRHCTFLMGMYLHSIDFPPYVNGWSHRGIILGSRFHKMKNLPPNGKFPFYKSFEGMFLPEHIRCPGPVGWHMSYFLTPRQLRNKLRSFMHSELATEENFKKHEMASRGEILLGSAKRKFSARWATRPKYIDMLMRNINDTRFDVLARYEDIFNQ